MKIILYQPEIPENTGNIVRTCKATGVPLILVTPLGFSTSNRRLKRAGLDYWDGVDVAEIDDLPNYLETSGCRPLFFSSKATRYHTEVSYRDDDLLIFGSETRGLPPYFSEKYPENFYKIPMQPDARCLNLANSVAIVLYEAWRQHQFAMRG